MRDISVHVSRHAKYQIELKFICPMQEGKKGGTYDIELYFFIPRNLAVNPENYDSRDFYNDFVEYIRFQTPQVSLKELASGNHEAFRRLQQSDPGRHREYSKALKMFCSIAKSAMRDAAGECAGRSGEKIDDFLNDVSRVLQNFRQERPDKTLFPESCELFDLVDEFLSLASNRYIYRLWRAAGKLDDHRLYGRIAEITGAELQYRRERQYLSLPRRDSDNSELVYRESALKKAMADILFLNVETRKAGILVENLLMGLAAAVAMIFVTGISFIWAGLLFDQFSLSFFVVWVVAYIFKDRIKSVMQGYFLKHRSRYSYDYRQKIRNDLGDVVGMCREGFHYCSEKDLDERIVKLRDRRTLSRLENASQRDNIMVFRKQIELSGRGCRDIYREFKVSGVVDILRMSTRHWTYKMDNPIRKIFVSDGKEISSLKASRDYHVNMILRYAGRNGCEKFERYRLILCRNGIRRLEKVAVPEN